MQTDLEIIRQVLIREQQRIEARGPEYIPNLRIIAHNITKLEQKRSRMQDHLDKELGNLANDPNA